MKFDPIWKELLTIQATERIKLRCRLPKDFDLLSSLKDLRSKYCSALEDMELDPRQTMLPVHDTVTSLKNGLEKIKEGMEIINDTEYQGIGDSNYIWRIMLQFSEKDDFQALLKYTKSENLQAIVSALKSADDTLSALPKDRGGKIKDIALERLAWGLMKIYQDATGSEIQIYKVNYGDEKINYKFAGEGCKFINKCLTLLYAQSDERSVLEKIVSTKKSKNKPKYEKWLREQPHY